MALIKRILIAVLVILLLQPAVLLAGKKKENKPGHSKPSGSYKPPKPHVNPFKGLAPIKAKPSEDIIGTGSQGDGGLNPFEETQANTVKDPQPDALADDGSSDDPDSGDAKPGGSLPKGFDQTARPGSKTVKSSKKKLAEDEKLASRKLSIARRLLESNPESALTRLQAIVTDYPETSAADEAKELLKKRADPASATTPDKTATPDKPAPDKRAVKKAAAK